MQFVDRWKFCPFLSFTIAYGSWLPALVLVEDCQSLPSWLMIKAMETRCSCSSCKLILHSYTRTARTSTPRLLANEPNMLVPVFPYKKHFKCLMQVSLPMKRWYSLSPSQVFLLYHFISKFYLSTDGGHSERGIRVQCSYF